MVEPSHISHLCHEGVAMTDARIEHVLGIQRPVANASPAAAYCHLRQVACAPDLSVLFRAGDGVGTRTQPCPGTPSEVD